MKLCKYHHACMLVFNYSNAKSAFNREKKILVSNQSWNTKSLKEKLMRTKIQCRKSSTVHKFKTYTNSMGKKIAAYTRQQHTYDMSSTLVEVNGKLNAHEKFCPRRLEEFGWPIRPFIMESFVLSSASTQHRSLKGSRRPTKARAQLCPRNGTNWWVGMRDSRIG